MSDVINMSEALKLDLDLFQGHVFDTPYVQRIFKLVSCRDTGTKVYRDSLSGLLRTPARTLDVQMSIFYLELADGNATEASVEKELDSLIRLPPALDKNKNLVNNHAANPSADRSLARTGSRYNADLCEIKLNVNGTEKTFNYHYADTIRPEVAADINALNRWRYITLRWNLGCSKAKDSTKPHLHTLQVDFILNRYAETPVDPTGLANFEEVMDDYNVAFAGRYLPGRFEPCKEQTRTAIADLITRQAIDPPDESRKWPTNYSQVMKYEAAKGRIRKEWKERCKANGMSVEEEKEVDLQALEGAAASDGSEEGGAEIASPAEKDDEFESTSTEEDAE